MSSRRLSDSQNFIVDSSVVARVLSKTKINKEDLVVEIGPGKGVITQHLGDACRKVIGVEYDRHLFEYLKKLFAQHRNISVVHEDFRDWDLPRERYSVFANIPFNMTADVVSKLFFTINPPDNTYLFMQDLAAKRFIGQPLAKNTQISVMLQPYYDVKVIDHVPTSSFFPRPNVKIVVVSFEKNLKPELEWQSREQFWDVVVYGYNQWQANVVAAFAKIFSHNQLNTLKKNLHLGGLKPSELRIEQWLGIYRAVKSLAGKESRALIWGARARLLKQQKGMIKRYRTKAVGRGYIFTPSWGR